MLFYCDIFLCIKLAISKKMRYNTNIKGATRSVTVRLNCYLLKKQPTTLREAVVFLVVMYLFGFARY